MQANAPPPLVRVVIVVNLANPVTALPRERISKMFLREISAWDNGQEILPVDQVEKSSARISFARDVQGQSVSALKRYWQERIFSGNESPPPERVTDADVLTYVRSNPGAIGYVVEGSDLGPGVKLVPIVDSGH
jgi:ABC-type phosphate transport system substrate-binding protein